MPVRQALNAVYARVVANMDSKERKAFIDDLYGFSEMNKAGNDVLRDIREADDAVTGSGDTSPPAGDGVAAVAVWGDR